MPGPIIGPPGARWALAGAMSAIEQAAIAAKALDFPSFRMVRSSSRQIEQQNLPIRS